MNCKRCLQRLYESKCSCKWPYDELLIDLLSLPSVFTVCLYRLSLTSIVQNLLLSFSKTFKLTVTMIGVFSAGKYFEGVNCPGAENEMKPLDSCAQCQTHHRVQQKAESAQHVDSICQKCGFFLPNRRTLLSNCWANVICRALCTRVGQKFLGTTSLCIT